LTDVSKRIEQSFNLYRDCTALCIGGVYHTYGELQRRVLAIQRLVEETSATSEPLIGVIADDSLDTYAAVLAILRAGRAFVPINPQHPAQRNAGILQQAGLQTLVVPRLDHADLHGIPPGLKLVLTQGHSSAECGAVAPSLASDLAYLLFTSGSTGEPKGVPITRGNLSAFLDSLASSGHGVRAGDRVLQMFDLTFDFSIATYLAPLSAGACIYTVPTGNAKFAEVYRLLSEERLTVAPLVPSVLTYLRPYFADIQLSDLRLTILCGEALFADIATEWMRCAPNSRVANFYGPTEATVFAMVYEWLPANGHDKAFKGVVSIGRPMPLNSAIVVDDARQPVPIGEKGELCLAGPQLTPGYWQDPSRNTEAFFEMPATGEYHRYYRTGDLVTADNDGDHYFCGRIGNQVKLQGFRIELGEIEYHAREVVRGCECVVISRVNRSGSGELSLFVENYSGDLKAILASLRARVPAYMVPVRALSVARLPMNSNGKIDRVALQRIVDEHHG
jgi:D-alanine--poly(phosphoribitol) ligase subunit 1